MSVAVSTFQHSAVNILTAPAVIIVECLQYFEKNVFLYSCGTHNTKYATNKSVTEPVQEYEYSLFETHLGITF